MFVFPDSAVFIKVSTAIRISTDMSNCHKKCPEYCLTQSLLGAIIFMHFYHLCKGMSSYLVEVHVKAHGLKLFFFTSCRRWYLCICDDWQSCFVCVHSLITHLQLKKMSVMYQSAHVIIAFQLLEMSSITTPNQTITNVCTR